MNYFLTKYVIYNLIIITTIVLFCYFYFRPANRKPYVMPIFNTRTELDNSVWSGYIEDVYKDKPTEGASNFPMDTSDFFVLYKDKLNDNNITINPNLVSNACFQQNKQNTLFDTLSSWSIINEDKYFLNKLPPFNCFEDFTYIEVTHAKGDPFNSGTWFYHSVGSGIWFNVGKTICFRKHADAVRHFLNENCVDNNDECVSQFPALFAAANAAGYKSVQFTEHGDQICGLRAMEIVHTVGQGFYSCGFDPSGDNFGASVAANFKTGWNYGISCVCDTSLGYLNCNLSTP